MLWGITWINVQTMLADAARLKELSDNENGAEEITRKIDNREEFEQYINSLM